MKALLVREFGADVGHLVLRRVVVDAAGAVVQKLSYVKKAKSDMFGVGGERLVADDVESGRIADVYWHLFELGSKPQLLHHVRAEHGFLHG